MDDRRKTGTRRRRRRGRNRPDFVDVGFVPRRVADLDDVGGPREEDGVIEGVAVEEAILIISRIGEED